MQRWPQYRSGYVSIRKRHMMTSSNGTIFRVTGPLCGEFIGPAEFPAQRPMTQSFDVFFGVRLNKRLSKHPWAWWFETPPWSLWRQCRELSYQKKSEQIDGLEQDCNNSIVKAVKLPQSCAKPSKCVEAKYLPHLADWIRKIGLFWTIPNHVFYGWGA